ncbi:MAG: DUF362 domain-containing protein, partial [Promethearchaeota archaeon]
KFDFLKAKKIVIKPNLLSDNKKACTQPIIVEGVINYLKQFGVSMNHVAVGDSPGQLKTSATNIAKKIGLFEICEKEGVRIIDFEEGTPLNVKIEGASRMSDFYVAKAIDDCDILINVPKLKTHAEATITGAIKNYWGIIPGGQKAKLHLLGKSAEKFGEVLVDNFSWIIKNKPNRLIVYDLQKIMQGPKGPGAGEMVEWNLILVGTDELACDTVALEIGRFNPKYVPHLKNAKERKLGIGNLEEIEIIGMTLEDAKNQIPKFKVPGKFITRIASFFSGRSFYKIVKKIPKLNEKNCEKCGQCSEICPADAINFEAKHYPRFIRKKCIACLCCMEMCPQHAIEVKRRGIGGIFHSY